jgi:hypothetical protein
VYTVMAEVFGKQEGGIADARRNLNRIREQRQRQGL